MRGRSRSRARACPGYLARMNQEFVDAARSVSPRALVDLLDHLGPQLDRLWQSLDLGATGEPVPWAVPGQPAPVWLDVAREYTELWVHQQQVRDAVGRPGANSDRLTWPVVDTLLRAVAKETDAPGVTRPAVPQASAGAS
jgi:Mycothiol maleylpyruvate isomerase N-terminal domain